MIINIGSLNPTKIAAVREVVAQYDSLRDAIINNVEVASGVSKQPRTVNKTIIGAENRAHHAFIGCDYSVGLESGLFCVPEITSPSRWMNFTVCSIYDGVAHAIGLSPAFEIPPAMARLILEQRCEMDDAVYQLGLSPDTRIGYGDGFIGILTHGTITRKDYMKPAIQMALARLQNRELYR